jgi:hypothetical protein
MKSLFLALRILAVVGAVCLCTRTVLAVYNTPDPLAPLGDPTVFRVVDPSYQPAAYAMPAPVTIEPVPAPDPAAQYAAAVMPPLLTVPGERCPAPAPHAWLTESTIYTRLDFANWNETIGGENFVDENGLQFTLGYQHRFDRERVRAEMFTSNLTFNEEWQRSWGTETAESTRKYLGARAELEILFEPETAPRVTFFVGLGTRFWVRDIPDEVTSANVPRFGYQETWWTFYPYIGIEKRRNLAVDWEFYWMGRLGFEAITLEKVSVFDIALWPEPGLTTQVEGGFRGKHLFASAFFEVFDWADSAPVQGLVQPASSLITVGLRTGCNF